MVTDATLEQLTDVLSVILLITVHIPIFTVGVLPCMLLYIVLQVTEVH